MPVHGMMDGYCGDEPELDEQERLLKQQQEWGQENEDIGGILFEAHWKDSFRKILLHT